MAGPTYLQDTRRGVIWTGVVLLDGAAVPPGARVAVALVPGDGWE
jgi:hypothetical protein